MGCGASKDNKKTAELDRELKVDRLRSLLNLKLLLLGPGESGKSTVLKQLKLIHDLQLTDAERATYLSSLKRNAAQCMQVLIDRTLNVYKLDLESAEDVARAELVKAYDLNEESKFTQKLADAIYALWQNAAIKQAFDKRNEYWILEAASYYFELAPKLATPTYSLTEEDIIMARVLSTGITSTAIEQPPVTYTVVDVGGQRTERRKWIHCFDNVKAILFIVNLADYNSVLFEDALVNRMVEAIRLFEQTANNPLFANTPFYLVLNKRDLFEQMLKVRPLTRCELFGDFTGDQSDVEACVNYVGDKFRSTLRTGEPDRLMVLSMSACHRPDVEVAWEKITARLLEQYGGEIRSTIRALHGNKGAPVDMGSLRDYSSSMSQVSLSTALPKA